MDRRGISPVIATVIIVAVTIAVSIAVAYWMGGLASFFTRFEKIEIGTAYATGSESSGFEIILTPIKNTGSADASITDVYINGKLLSTWSGISVNVTLPASVVAGGKINVMKISVPSSLSGTAPFTSGTTLSITLHTASGKDYPVNVALP